jgi:DNA-binding NtrC family response regulator
VLGRNENEYWLALKLYCRGGQQSNLTGKKIKNGTDEILKPFRYDLYNHLKAHEIHIPPLRERKEDIPLLVDYFLGKAAITAGIQKPAVPGELLPMLEKYHFPGNVGELKKMVNQAVSRCKSGFLSVDDFFMDTEVKEHQIPKF